MTANNEYTFASTVTNIAYMLPALCALERDPVVFVLFATLTITSALFHAFPAERILQKLDVVSIYAIFAYLPYYLTGNWQLLVLGGALSLPYIANKISPKRSVSSTSVVTAMFAGTAVLAWGGPYFWFAIGAFVLAGVFSLAAERLNKPGSYRYSDLLHGAWHVATAAGFTFLILN